MTRLAKTMHYMGTEKRQVFLPIFDDFHKPTTQVYTTANGPSVCFI